jgi:hypothetical protein
MRGRERKGMYCHVGVPTKEFGLAALAFYLLGGEGGQCTGLTTLPPSCADCLEIWESQPPGTLWASPGL